MPTYKWNQLTPRQQQSARRIRDELAEQHGIGVTVSQIAKHYDQAMEWKRGDLSLQDLIRIVGGCRSSRETHGGLNARVASLRQNPRKICPEQIFRFRRRRGPGFLIFPQS